MKVMKMMKPRNREEQPAIYIHSLGINFNACARDILGTPEFINVEYEDNKIILSRGERTDYKVSYSKRNQQRISGALFQNGYLSKIPNKTKIYGLFRKGRLEFEIPKECIAKP